MIRTMLNKPVSAARLMSIPFALMHVAVATVFLVPFSWPLVLLCLASYGIRMFAITGGYHRYFSHRSYKMSRPAQFAMACLGSTAMQKGVLWWAANHRLHHRHSDQPSDIHSPLQRGFWWSHVGWILSDQHEETHWDQIQDLAKYPELRWLNSWHLVPASLYGLGLFLAGGWPAFIWGFVVSTVLLWHGTFTINSLSHVYGQRRYETTDTSRNNFWLALITLGEGWHNNHHCYMSSTNQGFFWWEIDVSFYTIKALSAVGITRDLRKPPLALLEAKRIKLPSKGRRTQIPTPLPAADPVSGGSF
jgi:stearoyl-CoA desaturase (Delta-9 desaturase)